MSSAIGRRGGRARPALWLAAGLAALAAPALAQDTASAPVDPQRLALAREYVRESHIDAATRGMFANLARQMPQLSQDSDTDPRARQLMSSFSVGMDAAVPMLTEAMTQTTARLFTTQELKDLIAFYGSPTGKSLVAKLPMLMQQIAPQMYQIMPKVFTIAEADYCRHVTCIQADHDRFQRLQASLRAGPRAPAQPQ